MERKTQQSKWGSVVLTAAPSPRAQKTGGVPGPPTRKHRASSDKRLNDMLWIHNGLCGQYTARDTSEHKESFHIFHVKLTPVPSKPQNY